VKTIAGVTAMKKDVALADLHFADPACKPGDVGAGEAVEQRGLAQQAAQALDLGRGWFGRRGALERLAAKSVAVVHGVNA